ncbi:MAG TPA: polysaccharide deacetylase family protein [Solirubrobacteraceae bacterium]
MRLARLGLGAAAALWVGYAWGAHVMTLAATWRGPALGRRIALTFDDGPDPLWTPRIADALAERDVRATFFVVGQRAHAHPRAVRAIAAAGHEIASHGWSHRSLWFCGPRRTEDEVVRTQQWLSELTGNAPRFFRPPWGMVNASLFGVLRRANLSCVFWSIQPEGLRAQPADAQTTHVLARAHAGAIVDLHDADGVPGAPERLAAALPAMIDGLRDQGYTLTTVGELLA